MNPKGRMTFWQKNKHIAHKRRIISKIRITTVHNLKKIIICSLSVLGMGPSTCSLDARSVLGLFHGARARVLESEHMLVLARARG